MDLWHSMELEGFEELLFVQDVGSGLKGLVVIHNTKAGPALGGCRMWAYKTEEEAIWDGMRLAKGMTYKSAISGLPYGGGKAVVFGNPEPPRREAWFRALGRFIDSLGGKYITGIDLGTKVEDMDAIAVETPYVTDMTGTLGGSGNLTAEMTAYGVFLGILASLREAEEETAASVAGKKVAVQGLGKVGFALCRYLREAGAELVVTDINGELADKAVREYGAVYAEPEQICAESCDVFAPCALGGILDAGTVGRLNCQIVAGAANNQLAAADSAELLKKRGILYAPDYAINAGGIIATALELEGGAPEVIRRRVENISGTLADVYRLAKSGGLTTAAAADRLAEAKLASL